MSIESVLANEERWHVEVGDVMEGLRRCPDRVFQAVVTSPPYWGLRSYLKAGDAGKGKEIGSEKTPEEFIAKIVKVFGEVRRVLRDDGTLWLNLGDKFADDTKWGGRTDGKHAKGLHGQTGIGRNRATTGIDAGNQLLMPHRVAMAMQADGWILRSTIIWAKKSPMPESVSGWRWRRCRVKVKPSKRGRNKHAGGNGQKPHGERDGPAFASEATWKPCPGCDKCRPNGGLVLRRGKWRPTTAHEYIFLFSKSESYFCDGDAVKELCSQNTHSKGSNRHHKNGQEGVERQNASFQSAIGDPVQFRNPRSVWELGNEPEKAKHFATFPSAIPRKCLKAATSAAGCCPKCGASYAPIVVSERLATRPGTDSKVIGAMNAESPYMDHQSIGNRDPQRHIAVTRVSGYRPTCQCKDAGDPVPSIVADIFSGSGTTGRVAYSMGLRYIGCELSEEYAAISREKIVRPFAKKKPVPKHKRPMDGQKPLFE